MSNTDLLKAIFSENATEIQDIYEVGPQYVKPVVTLRDADSLYIDRYFVQAVTDPNYIVEVDNIQYDTFKTNPRFTSAKIRWKIVGKQESIRTTGNTVLYGVGDINRDEILRTDLTMPGIRLYIRDYTEFWVSEES
jgi:hypothetical protein